jgi:hypothetical protein
MYSHATPEAFHDHRIRAFDPMQVMGVSQWRTHGKEFGYWQFFQKDVLESYRAELREKMSKIDVSGGGSGRRLQMQILDLLKEPA